MVAAMDVYKIYCDEEVKYFFCSDGVIGSRNGLIKLSTTNRKDVCEWSQIRRTLPGKADGNPELSSSTLLIFTSVSRCQSVTVGTQKT